MNVCKERGIGCDLATGLGFCSVTWCIKQNRVSNISIIPTVTVTDTPMVEYAPVVHGEWIPVTERLPKIGEKVLVSTKYTVFTQVFKRIYGTPDRWGWEHNTIKKVSAWMPLPEPYKMDGEEQNDEE